MLLSIIFSFFVSASSIDTASLGIISLVPISFVETILKYFKVLRTYNATPLIDPLSSTLMASKL